MNDKKVYAYNELTQVVAAVPAHYLTHPVLGANLRKVTSGKTRGRLSEVVESKEDSGKSLTNDAKVRGDSAAVRTEQDKED